MIPWWAQFCSLDWIANHNDRTNILHLHVLLHCELLNWSVFWIYDHSSYINLVSSSSFFHHLPWGVSLKSFSLTWLVSYPSEKGTESSRDNFMSIVITYRSIITIILFNLRKAKSFRNIFHTMHIYQPWHISTLLTRLSPQQSLVILVGLLKAVVFPLWNHLCHNQLLISYPRQNRRWHWWGYSQKSCGYHGKS